MYVAQKSADRFTAEGALWFAGFFVVIGGLDDDFGAVDRFITDGALGLEVGFTTLGGVQWIDRVTGAGSQDDQQGEWGEAVHCFHGAPLAV